MAQINPQRARASSLTVAPACMFPGHGPESCSLPEGGSRARRMRLQVVVYMREMVIPWGLDSKARL